MAATQIQPCLAQFLSNPVQGPGLDPFILYGLPSLQWTHALFGLVGSAVGKCMGPLRTEQVNKPWASAPGVRRQNNRAPTPSFIPAAEAIWVAIPSRNRHPPPCTFILSPLLPGRWTTLPLQKTLVPRKQLIPPSLFPTETPKPRPMVKLPNNTSH